MKYCIRELEGFPVIGQGVELTNFQAGNLQISTQFWRTFNAKLKKASLSQSGNWLKYAFMERKNGKLFYFCAIPKKAAVPEGFILREIKPHQYLVTEHTGAMNRLYDTYGKLYRELLPGAGYEPSPAEFLHFERYDERFYWNREDSVIELWVPIQSKS